MDDMGVVRQFKGGEKSDDRNEIAQIEKCAFVCNLPFFAILDM